jgi:hypothetical protein
MPAMLSSSRGFLVSAGVERVESKTTAYKPTSGAFLTTVPHYPFSGFLDNLSRYLAAISEAFSRNKKEEFSADLAVPVCGSDRSGVSLVSRL